MTRTLSTPLKFALVLTLIPLLAAIAAVATVVGLAGSEPGTRFLLGEAQRRTAGLVSWRHAGGTLFGPLRLEGVEVDQPGMRLTIDSLTLDWSPTALRGRTLQVDSLEASGVRISLSAAETEEPAGDPPTPGALRPPVDIILTGVRLRDLALLQEGQAVAGIERIDLDARLEQGQLRLEQLAVRLAGGGLSLAGTTALDDDMPLSLQAAWDWRLATGDAPPTSGTATPDGIPLRGELAIDGRLTWRDGIAADLAYRADTDGLDGLSPELPASTRLSGILRGRYLDDAVELGELSLALDGTPMALVARGQIAQLGSAAPSIDTTLQWTGLSWPLAGDEALVSSARGELQLAGSLEAYEVGLSADLAGRDLPDSSWQGDGSGDLRQIRLRRLEGRLLDGTLAIVGPVTWDPVPGWELRVEGSELNPGALLPDLPGQLAFALNVKGRLDPERGVAAELALERASGRVLDYPFDLSARARLLDDNVQLDRLELASAGNRVVARGELSPDTLALDWELEAPAPGALLPGASGALSGRGTVTGSAESPHLRARLQGRKLQFDALALETASAELEAGLAADDALEIAIQAGPLRQAERELLTALRLEARGTTAAHRLDLDLATADDRLQAGLEGG
jgi:translocation and assembly module TamB